VVLVAAALVVIAGFIVFGRGGKEGAADNAAKVARYCALATEFDRLAPNTVGGAARVARSAGVISRLLQEMGGTVAEMKADAPAAIHSDVAATVKAVQEAAKGNPAGMRSAAFQAHRRSIAGFRQKMCSVGAGSGDS